MIEGRCPKCGTYYRGWALLNPRHQSCPKCGVGLKITDGGQVFTGYSPFAGERYQINPPTNAPSSQEREKDSRLQDE